MAFVNEYVQPDDIKQFKFDERYLRDHPEYQSLPSTFSPQWTIDREHNIYLRFLRTANQAYLAESWTECELFLDGVLFRCRLDTGVGQSVKLNESPYIIVWNLISLLPNGLHGKPRDMVVEVLKEALITYGYSGVRKQLPNTIVKFNF